MHFNSFQHPGLDVAAKGKSGQRDGQIALFAPRMTGQRQHVFGFADAVIELSRTLPDAAEVEAKCSQSEAAESPGQCRHHLVVHGAAMQRMGMGNQGNAAAIAAGQGDSRFELARGSVDKKVLRGHGWKMRELPECGQLYGAVGCLARGVGG